MAKRRRNKNKQVQVRTQQPATTVISPPPVTKQEQGSALQTISQQRAKHALAQVQSWTDIKQHKELKSYTVGMPAMILMSGFGQTCAFYKSKGDNHAVVLGALQDWLGKGDLIKHITTSTAKEYQLAQAESLEYLNWLKKFAKAYLKDEKDTQGED